MSERLWDAKHDYYCNQGNYFNDGCGQTYESWADFFDSEGNSDPDMNLLFRWDWYEGGEWGVPDGECHLFLFWVGQRKGLFRYSEVHVSRDDEPAIRKWLEGRFVHLKALWQPLA